MVKEPLVRPVKFFKPPAVRSDPQPARSIFINRLYHIMAERLRILRIGLVSDEFSASRIEPVKAAVGTYPECPHPIPVYAPDNIIAQTEAIVRIISIALP